MKREGGEPLPSLLCGFDGPLLTPLNTFSSRVRHDCGVGRGGVRWWGETEKAKRGIIKKEEQGLETGDLNMCSAP